MRSDAVRPTSVVQHETWGRRQVPPSEQVRPGVWAIPIPVHSIPIRFTYCYLVIADAGCLLIDTGAASDEGVEALEAGLRSAGVLLSDVVGIVVTHFHFDHWESADRVAEAAGAWVAMGEQEQAWVDTLTDTALSVEAAISRLRDVGVPADTAHALAQGEDYRYTRDHVRPARLLRDGAYVPVDGTRLRVLWTPGHTPGHICLHDEERGLLFSGDHVLPRITPHIALNPFGASDPLGQYVDALSRVACACPDVEVLPAHEYRFAGLAARADELTDEIEQRLHEVRVLATAEPTATPWQIAQRLTWSRPWAEFSANAQRMALVETLSFLKYRSTT